MRKSRRPPQEVRVEEKGLLAEGLGMERPDKGIGGGINTSIAPEEVEEVLVKSEVMPAMAGVEMEEKGFSPTSPVWPLGTAVVEPAGRGTEPVVPVDWAVEEMPGVMPRVRARTGQRIREEVEAETDMPQAIIREKVGRGL
jgi:hypothetical protein